MELPEWIIEEMREAARRWSKAGEAVSKTLSDPWPIPYTDLKAVFDEYELRGKEFSEVHKRASEIARQ